jgi:SAM-dependent MidA family methyltransferase
MELALYHPELGYYARAARRSGRAGDFFTSVDVGPLFGEVLEIQLAEMADLLARLPAADLNPVFDLVEAGAGDGRLSADILKAARHRDPTVYERTKLHLVERSSAARALQPQTLGEHADRLASSHEHLPASFEGVLLANELLDAMPVHQLVMRPDGLREIYVAAAGGRLTTREGPPSTPALAAYLWRLKIAPEPGWRFEINLAALDWVGAAARRLSRGFIILIDYGHEARELYSASHAAGTLTTFARHIGFEPSPAGAPSWLLDAGAQDVTAHVDFTSVRDAAEAEGMVTLGFLDQTYFLLGLLDVDRAAQEDFKRRLALKTLLMPGALGSTMKVLLLAKNVGTPALRGCSYRMRVT